jgi:uncharacterized protein YjaZ
MKYFKTILLLTIILSLNSIVSSQIILNDSLTCFNKEQLKKIVKDLKKVEIQDSIIQTQQLQIINFKEVLKVDNSIIAENDKRLLELTKDLNKANLKLKISKRLTFVGVPIAITGGFILGILIN